MPSTTAAEPDLSPELAAFLDDGEPPIVFTLGSAAVYDPGPFFDESAKAAALLRRRAVLLIGPEAGQIVGAGPDVAVFGYAPFSKLFPRAAPVVHQGGSGTTGQVMRAGRPMLVVPYAHDQPDNALRARKLGIAASLGATPTTPRTPRRPSGRSSQIGPSPRVPPKSARSCRGENGAATAADAIEAHLRPR